MSTQQLSRNIIDELRRSGTVSAHDLYVALGGLKSTNMELDAFRTFIELQCDDTIKKTAGGDENTSPKYSLSNRVVRKRSTMKKRSSSKSGARTASGSGTPEGTLNFKTREHGAYALFGAVRQLAVKSSDGVISWNDVRNVYRKKTTRHLNTDELNHICGTTNETKANLIKHAPIMSAFIVPLDDKCLMVRLSNYQPGDPPISTPSPIASHGQHSPALTSGQVSPTAQRFSDGVADYSVSEAELVAKRQEVLKNLELKGVRLSADGKVARDCAASDSSNGDINSHTETASVATLAVSASGDHCEHDVDEVFEEEVDSQPLQQEKHQVDLDQSQAEAEPVAEGAGVFSDRTNVSALERDQSGYGNNSTMNVAFIEGDSQQLMSMSTSFMSAMDALTPTPAETSGEQGYTTGAENHNLSMSDADVSLNMDQNLENDDEPPTPMPVHEITLCSSRNEDDLGFQMPQPDLSPVCQEDHDTSIVTIKEPAHHVSPGIAATIKKLQSQSFSTDEPEDVNSHQEIEHAMVSSPSSTCQFEHKETSIVYDTDVQAKAEEAFLREDRRNSIPTISEISGFQNDESLLSNHGSSSNVSEGLPVCDNITPREDAQTASIVTIIERPPSATADLENMDPAAADLVATKDSVDTDSEDIPYDTEADDSQPSSPNVRTVTVEVELEKSKLSQESEKCEQQLASSEVREANATVHTVKAFLNDVENCEQQKSPEKVNESTGGVETLSLDEELKECQIAFEPREPAIEAENAADDSATDKKNPKKEKKKVRVVVPRRRLINCCTII